MKLNFVIFLLVICFVSCKNNNKSIAIENSSLNYQKIPTSSSGLDFNNVLVSDLKTKSNLFDDDYFYNGAGVGIEDINNDGLKDIFFCGNQVPNKLYLNKGNLVFEDISTSANINPLNKNWSNGVTFADVNNDGWMDIYVAQGGPYKKEKRKNLLFINQKDNTFKEEASLYGLDDHSISTQAAFLDFDKDGDLDCVVLNENDFYGVDPAIFYKILKDKKQLKENSSHLYKNDNGKFTDVTEQAGLLTPTFGLGLCISDLNNDNWPDIYIVNDYYLPDAIYINNKNGTFSNQTKKLTNQISFSGMGIDIADINNDNLQDIFVLDMAPISHEKSLTLMSSMNVSQFNFLNKTLGYQVQYMFNSLQLNLGNNKYHNIAQLTNLAKSGWSWAVLLFDTDNDGNDDVYITNGYRKYGSDKDARVRVSKAKRLFKGDVPLAVKEDLYNSLPSEKLTNLLFKNKGNLNFEDVTKLSGLEDPSFSNGAAYADLDNDGDLDIVVNNIDDKAFLYKNMAVENGLGNYIKIVTKGILSEDFAKVSIKYNGKTRTKEAKRVRGYRSAVDKTIHFGIGKDSILDEVKVVWLSGKHQELYNVKANTTLTFKEIEAQNSNTKPIINSKLLFTNIEGLIDFTHKENDFNDFEKEILLPYKQSTLGPYITKGDVNGDGNDDVYIGGAHGQSGQLFIQTKKGFLNVKNKVFEEDSQYEDMEALFIDIDNDNDNDLYIVSGGSEFNERSEYLKDRIYLNDGKGNFSRFGPSEIDYYTISGKTVTKIDFDKDGDFDLIVGNRIKPQKYPLHDPSLIYENVKGTFKNVTAIVAPEFENFGIVNKVIATDFNNDGWEDFIAVGEWTHIGIFINDKHNNFKDISGLSGLDKETGWWFSIIPTDVNNDGKKDYLIGNIGLNYKYKASPKNPLYIYANDFDLNGTLDVVLSVNNKGKFVPVRGKECSTRQMAFISKKIPTFSQFANASLEEIYGKKIFTSYQKEATQFKSILLLNEGEGKFKKIELPNMIQSMPILDGDTYDFNKDGFEDIIVVGNIYNTEVETPRLDNPFALVLLSNKKDGYTVLGPDKTGLYIDGNAKSVKLIKQNYLKKILAIITMNNAKTKTFELNN
ncbi:MAG: VCBS repeat-containing protein [Chlorobi bacterium]|nr:VCBS repeat-containing protein [Chlorobiota bacterium]